MMYGWGYGYDLGSFLFMALLMLLIVVGVVAMLRHLGNGSTGSQGETPFDILKRQYANGEIDKREFEEKKKDLGA